MITTIPRKDKMGPADLVGLEQYRRLYVADFHIDGAQDWKPVEWGFWHPGGRIVNVDHHAPAPQMQQHVTSTTLAINLMAGRHLARRGSHRP